MTHFLPLISDQSSLQLYGYFPETFDSFVLYTEEKLAGDLYTVPTMYNEGVTEFLF